MFIDNVNNRFKMLLFYALKHCDIGDNASKHTAKKHKSLTEYLEVAS